MVTKLISGFPSISRINIFQSASPSWQKVALATVALTVVGYGVKLLIDRCSVKAKADPKVDKAEEKRDITPYLNQLIEELKRKMDTPYTYAAEEGISSFKRSLLNDEEMPVQTSGSMFLISMNTILKIKCLSDGQQTELQGEQLETVRKLLFPTQQEVIDSIKEAIKMAPRDAVWINYSGKDAFQPPKIRANAMKFFIGPGSAHNRIISVRTADGRYWEVNSSQDRYFMTQYIKGGYRAIDEVVEFSPSRYRNSAMADSINISDKVCEEISELIFEKLKTDP